MPMITQPNRAESEGLSPTVKMDRRLERLVWWYDHGFGTENAVKTELQHELDRLATQRHALHGQEGALRAFDEGQRLLREFDLSSGQALTHLRMSRFASALGQLRTSKAILFQMTETVAILAKQDAIRAGFRSLITELGLQSLQSCTTFKIQERILELARDFLIHGQQRKARYVTGWCEKDLRRWQVTTPVSPSDKVELLDKMQKLSDRRDSKDPLQNHHASEQNPRFRRLAFLIERGHLTLTEQLLSDIEISEAVSARHNEPIVGDAPSDSPRSRELNSLTAGLVHTTKHAHLLQTKLSNL